MPAALSAKHIDDFAGLFAAHRVPEFLYCRHIEGEVVAVSRLHALCICIDQSAENFVQGAFIFRAYRSEDGLYAVFIPADYLGYLEFGNHIAEHRAGKA